MKIKKRIKKRDWRTSGLQLLMHEKCRVPPWSRKIINFRKSYSGILIGAKCIGVAALEDDWKISEEIATPNNSVWYVIEIDFPSCGMEKPVIITNGYYWYPTTCVAAPLYQSDLRFLRRMSKADKSLIDCSIKDFLN